MYASGQRRYVQRHLKAVLHEVLHALQQLGLRQPWAKQFAHARDNARHILAIDHAFAWPLHGFRQHLQVGQHQQMVQAHHKPGVVQAGAQGCVLPLQLRLHVL